jgi:hypothetical protein
MDKTTHTPGPWHSNKSAVYWSPAGKTVADGYRPIASCHDELHGRMTGVDTYPEDCANAAYIARACNSHDDLVEALEPLVVWAEHERREHRAKGEENEEAFMGNLVDAARAAIAKARGEVTP